MKAIVSLLLLVASTAPAQQTEPDSGDVVRLKVGTEISGRITSQTDDHVFLETGPGETVGFSMDQVESIARGAIAVRSEPVEPVAAAWSAPRDDWFVLHDAKGRGVGHLHETVTTDAAGNVRLTEEWHFVQDGRVTAITRLEICSAEGAPISAFSHERSFDKRERLTAERCVRAEVSADRIRVTRRTMRGDEQGEYELAPGTRLPLELRAALRNKAQGTHGVRTHAVYDALLDRFSQSQWDLGRIRRIPGPRGDVQRVRVLQTHGGEEWLDAAGRTLRRELNGPALVAIPSSEKDARRIASGTLYPQSLKAEADGRFAMWLPNPAWAFESDDVAGQVTARNRVDEASMTLLRFDQLESTLGLGSASDAVVRWLRLVQPDFRVLERAETVLRGAPATLLRGRFVAKDASGQPRAFDSVTYVVQVGEVWYVALGSAPQALFAQVQSDFLWMAERFELDPNGFAPTPSGPLADKPRR
ncbi:MAG: hypothetical protein AB7I19_08035 [Planctomycetota bacterium]